MIKAVEVIDANGESNLTQKYYRWPFVYLSYELVDELGYESDIVLFSSAPPTMRDYMISDPLDGVYRVESNNGKEPILCSLNKVNSGEYVLNKAI